MQENDIGPDDSMELEPVDIGEPNPDVEVILDVRLTRHEMSAVQRLASEWGVLPSRAIKRLVDEGYMREREARRSSPLLQPGVAAPDT